MKLSYSDTSKMQEVGDSIISLSSEYEQIINRFFARMNRVPYDTREWVGNQSVKYFNLIALEKDDFLNFGKEIKKIGNVIKKHADSIDLQIKRNGNIEGEK